MANISASMVKELRDRTGLGMMDCKKALVESDGNMDSAIKILREKGIIKSAKKSGRETNEGIINVFHNDKEAVMIQMNCETDFVVRNEKFQELFKEIGDEVLNNENINDPEKLPEDMENKIKEGIATIGENIKLSKISRMKKNESNEYIENYVHNNNKVGVLLKTKVEKPETTNKDEFKNLNKDLCMQIAAMDVKAISKDDVDQDWLNSEKEVFVNQAKDSGKPDNIIEKIVNGKIQKLLSDITLLGQKFVKDDQFTVEKLMNKVSKDLSDKIQAVEFHKFSI